MLPVHVFGKRDLQLAYNSKRLADVQKLTTEGANTEFKEQDNQVQVETMNYQLQAAKAAQVSAKLAMDSEISGVNTTVAQIQAQLEDAKWQLDQAAMALAAGDRATQARAVMSVGASDRADTCS
jgi:multidrug resistance efflux pump